MLALILILSATLLPFNLSTWNMNTEKITTQVIEEEGNGASYSLERIWDTFLKELSVLFAQHWTNMPQGADRHSLVHMTILLLKFVPTGLYGLYLFKLVKDMYLTSRDRIRQKQSDLEDIELQLQIVNTKLCVRDAEFNERAEQLRRGAERLRNIRIRVRDLIASDDILRQLLSAAQNDECDQNEQQNVTKEGDRDFFVDLLSGYGPIFGFGDNNMSMSERSPEKLDCGEHPPTNQNSPENSVYSSLSDVDVHQDCRVKIVKITNVYKVAYLKHYIKLKRLRRASKQALLKKKIESIKSLLEDWQKTLNMVINSKLSLLNIDHHAVDGISQEAMGDYSKRHELSDSDSDKRNNSWSDVCYDECVNWPNNSYRPYANNYEDGSEAVNSKDCPDFQDYGEGRYCSPAMYYDYDKRINMMAIVEETNSQIANEDNKSEPDDSTDCLHIVAH